MKMLQKRFYNLWGNKTPWRDLSGTIIPDFITKAEQHLPIYKMLDKKFHGDTIPIKQFFEKKKKMRIFSWNGDRDTMFSTVDSIKYYSKILNTGMMTIEHS